VPHATSLALTTGMTLEAWIAPEDNAGYRTVLMKERPAGLSYALYGAGKVGRPALHAQTSSERSAAGPSALPLATWTHLAGTFDGSTLRLYVNGTQVATRALTGSLAASTEALSIGGNAVWGEWFQGRIDEVRVYSRVLTAADIQADMTRPVQGGT
jgi:hypothetical protein